MISPRDVIADFIGVHEGVLSVHPADNGNWYDPVRFRARLKQLRGVGTLVGSKFGVTAYALVRYRLRTGMQRDAALSVRRADMAALDLKTAIAIGVELYYLEPKLVQLAWNRVTASILDKAWGSGPDRAIRMLQELLGFSKPDGDLGPNTSAAYAAWIMSHGEDAAAHLWCDKRIAFDHSLGSNEGEHDPDRVFVGGWNNRSRSFLPGTPWWKKAGK